MNKTFAFEKNRLLQRAIYEKNCKEVTVLLSQGAHIDHVVNRSLDTMLHTAENARVARDLLGFGADVNARNKCQRTPLHSAVIDGKGVEMVLTLILHGASVDVEDAQGNTALHYAVKVQDQNLDVMKVLILSGASIKAHRLCSPLFDAFSLDDMPTVKVLTAYTLFKVSADNLRIPLLNLIWDSALGTRLCQVWNMHYEFFVKSCKDELYHMYKEKLAIGITLLEAVISPHKAFGDRKRTRLFVKDIYEVLTSGRYPIYSDVIFNQLRLKVEKKYLLHILPSINIYTKLVECNRNKSKYIVLNLDVTKELAKYLSSDSLFSLVLAFYKPKEKLQINQFPLRNLPLKRDILIKRSNEALESSSSKHWKLNLI